MKSTKKRFVYNRFFYFSPFVLIWDIAEIQMNLVLDQIIDAADSIYFPCANIQKYT